VIVVDSNTWADFFNGTQTPHVERLELALGQEEDIAILPVIVTEVLQGFRSESGFRKAEHVLTALPLISPDVASHVRAARLFRRLRAKGVTVRGAVDCIIAQTCLDTNAQLLSPDGDFANIARHTSLSLWQRQ
jgi:predicted nucleic acid-binding protein